MLRVRADHSHHTLAVNHLALVTNLSDGRAHLHFDPSSIYNGRLCAHDSNRKEITQPKLDRREEF